MTTPTQDAAGALLRRHTEITSPTTFRLLGQEWDLLPGVYAPHLTRSAALYAEWLPYPVNGAFCEVGCGTGYLAVTAAQRGCARVTALDLNPGAVDNAARNARRHGVGERVHTAAGDMFAPLPTDDRYDVIFWNSNFVDGDPGERSGTHLEDAFFDPGYAAHATYLREARDHLAPGGRLLLGFTDLGSVRLLAKVAAEHGWRPHPVRAVRCSTGMGQLGFQLVEFHSL